MKIKKNIRYLERQLSQIVGSSSDRKTLLFNIINYFQIEKVCEVGVWRGDFSDFLLQIKDIRKLYSVDPWEYQDAWEKPNNISNNEFDNVFREAEIKLSKYGTRSVIIRSRFAAVKPSLLSDVDLFYIDGDHTLKGIFFDLCSAYKFSKNSWIILDDVCENIWQHGINYQPTLVWPFAKYFSQFYGYSIFLLPYNQALLIPGKRFKVFNLSNIDYNESVENWVPSQSIISKMRKASNFVRRFLRGSGQ